MSKKNIIILISVFAVVGIAGYILMKKEDSESDVKPETKGKQGFDAVKALSNRQDMMNRQDVMNQLPTKRTTGEFDKIALDRNTNQYQ